MGEARRRGSREQRVEQAIRRTLIAETDSIKQAQVDQEVTIRRRSKPSKASMVLAALMTSSGFGL